MTDDENRNQYYLSRSTKRLNRDMRLIREDPIPEIDVALNEDDILEWHFAIHGKEGTPYQGGVYHGRLVFPPTFPFGPPKILFLTPNGRFRVNERICFSLSDFHPEEWKPAYSVTAVLRGVYDFMHEATDTIGSIDATDSERRRLARESMQHNRDNSSFCNFFPHLCSIEDTTDEEKMDTGIEQNTMPPEADDIFTNPDQITNSPVEMHNDQITKRPSPESQEMDKTPVEYVNPLQPSEMDVSQSFSPQQMDNIPIEYLDTHQPSEMDVIRNLTPQPMDVTPVEIHDFQKSIEKSVSLPILATSLPGNNNYQFPTSVSPVGNTELPHTGETSISPPIIAATIAKNDNDNIPPSPSRSVKTYPVEDPNSMQPTHMNVDPPFIVTRSTGYKSPLDTGHKRELNVAKGIPGNIVPGKEYYQIDNVIVRSQNPDINHFEPRNTSNFSKTDNNLPGYPSQKCPNIYGEIIQKRIGETTLSHVPPHYSTPRMHKTGDQNDIKRLEEGTLPFKASYSQTDINIVHIRCYSVFFLFIVFSYGLVLIYFLLHVTVFK